MIGGSTYCAVAALKLMNEMDAGLLSKQDTIKWCLNRQGSGFHGRANKPEDTCYSFWIGGSLEVNNIFYPPIMESKIRNSTDLL